MKTKSIKNSNNAVVGIVAAFLIIGLIVAVLSVIQTQYVPKWMREKEADHMNLVADQFAQLKYAVDTHISNQRKNIPISTTITLGSKEMPYFMSLRAFGQLKILQNSFNITINGSTNYTTLLGIIKYSSYNNYFINQEYIYECDGVILSQASGDTMYIKPSLSVTYGETVENITLHFQIVNITVIGGKDQSAHGYGPAPIQTEFKKIEDLEPIEDVKYINITTNYNHSWYSFINTTLIKAGLNYDKSALDYEMFIDNDTVVVHFFDTVNVTVNLDYIEIGAQIAPGWIEERK